MANKKITTKKKGCEIYLFSEGDFHFLCGDIFDKEIQLCKNCEGTKGYLSEFREVFKGKIIKPIKDTEN